MQSLCDKTCLNISSIYIHRIYTHTDLILSSQNRCITGILSFLFGFCWSSYCHTHKKTDTYSHRPPGVQNKEDAFNQTCRCTDKWLYTAAIAYGSALQYGAVLNWSHNNNCNNCTTNHTFPPITWFGGTFITHKNSPQRCCTTIYLTCHTIILYLCLWMLILRNKYILYSPVNDNHRLHDKNVKLLAHRCHLWS